MVQGIRDKDGQWTSLQLEQGAVYVVKTRKYPIDSLGVSHGDIKLDTLLTSGYYEVRAYTRYMTNWGTNAVFSRVIPVFKAPKTEGNYSDLTIRTMLYSNRDPNNRTDEDSLYQKAIDTLTTVIVRIRFIRRR